MPDTDPWMLLPQAVQHTGVSERELRRFYTMPEADPKHLRAVKHLSKVKMRRSWLDDWMHRTSEEL